MQMLVVAAVSLRNLTGQPDASLSDMKKWVEVLREKGAELELFDERKLADGE
jgi:hypothetical protein